MFIIDFFSWLARLSSCVYIIALLINLIFG